jgi:ubiquinone/menaquinone biosynthesis C-methylase UbiE
MTQRDVFMQGEADQWYERNRNALSDEQKILKDPLLRVFSSWVPASAPLSVLEVGCANGWRLKALREIWPQATFFGIDPSSKAIAQSESRKIQLQVGTAEKLPYKNSSINLLVFGFCLYLVDRDHLFEIAAEADRVLAENGKIAILDFFSDRPYSNPYTHRAGIRSFKMDYSKLWSWNPAYKLDTHSVMSHDGGPLENPDDAIAVSILQKDSGQVWGNEFIDRTKT